METELCLHGFGSYLFYSEAIDVEEITQGKEEAKDKFLENLNI